MSKLKVEFNYTTSPWISICIAYSILGSSERTETSHRRDEYLQDRVVEDRGDCRSRETRCHLREPRSKITAANLVRCGYGIRLNDRGSSGSHLVWLWYEATF